MLGKIWDEVVALRVEIITMTRLIRALLDRLTETESLRTSEAIIYCGLQTDHCLYKWRKAGMVRGSHGRWNRRDLEVILRSRVLEAINHRPPDIESGVDRLAL